eukprot:1550885-Pleurochrysis_carterae.AAC.4
MTCESTGVNGDKSLLALPSELLVRIALELVPPGCFSRTAAEWTHLVRLAATCTVLHGAVGEALQMFPATCPAVKIASMDTRVTYASDIFPPACALECSK